MEGIATVMEYEPCQRAAWDVRLGSFAMRQAIAVLPEQGGVATRLQLCIETRAKGPIAFFLPLLRGRLRSTMRQSLARSNP